MSPAYSIYLDLVRFLAAFLVYLYHSNQRWLVTDTLPLSNYGHTSVIVFFVLSGYVISHITETREKDWVSYGVSRVSRVFSVALPAIVLTVLLDALGRQLMPAIYGDYPFDHFFSRIASSLLMGNEPWFISVTFFSNVPYWSITYEFWYYVLFGLIFFLPRRAGIAAALLVVGLLGPKILLLAPIWVAGVLLQRWRSLKSMTLPVAWSLVLGSIVLMVAFHLTGCPERITESLKALMGESAHKNLTFSKFFLADYIIGLLVFANFAGMLRVADQLEAPMRLIERPVRLLASYTFVLYLLHQPLFLFWGALWKGDPSNLGAWLTVTLLTGVSVAVLGRLTERWRSQMRKTGMRWLGRYGGARVPPGVRGA